MIALLVILLGISILAITAWSDRRSEKSVEERRRRAELTIDREAESARRAMNDAAGQSWRNLVD